MLQNNTNSHKDHENIFTILRKIIINNGKIIINISKSDYNQSKNNNYYKRIIITGHANYDDFGKDIVCAAVSSTVITSVNSCLAIDNESISYEDKNGLDIKVLKDDEVTTKIINVMITNLYELEKAYPKNIKIKEENNE